MNKSLFVATAMLCGLALPVMAEPTAGLGLSIAFGAGKVEPGVGLRVFSDNDKRKTVASAGIDYMIGANRVRPTVGVAYLGSRTYVGADLGFGLYGEGFDVGLGAGVVKTK